MQRLYTANSGSNNGMHNRSIFTITQTFFHLSQHHSLFLSFRLMQMSKQTVQFYTYYSTFYSFLLICKRVMKKTVPIYIYLPIFHLIYFVLFHILTVLIRYQGSKLRPFWSHMLPKCNLCDSKIYLGAFVRVQIIVVVRPLQFSAKRSRITAQHVPRDRELTWN